MSMEAERRAKPQAAKTEYLNHANKPQNMMEIPLIKMKRPRSRTVANGEKVAKN